MKWNYIFLLMLFNFSFLNSQSIEYTYDSLDRLTYVLYPDSSYIAYTYDASGNRMSMTGVKSNIIKACPQSNVTFQAGTEDPGNTYQWQVNTVGGFADIEDGAVYSGTDTPLLSLNSPPTDWYGHKYRCAITGPGGESYSPVFTLKFETKWTGTENVLWENALNWSCGLLPDEDTDVLIDATAKHFPEVNSEAVCRSVSLQYKTSLIVTSLHELSVKGGKE